MCTLVLEFRYLKISSSTVAMDREFDANSLAAGSPWYLIDPAIGRAGRGVGSREGGPSGF